MDVSRVRKPKGLVGESALLTAVIHRAYLDLFIKNKRGSALEYFRSDRFLIDKMLLGRDVEDMPHVLQEYSSSFDLPKRSKSKAPSP